MNQPSAFIDVSDGGLWCACGDAPPNPAAPTVVFLHGFSVDHRMWAEDAAALSGIAATINYDLRGFGRSGMPHPGRNHVDDLVEVLDRLEIESAVLVGLSLGANIALGMAHQHPQRVDAMVLASSGLPGRAWTTPRAPDLVLAHAQKYDVLSAKEYWLSLDLFSQTRARPAAMAVLNQMVQDFPAHQWSNELPGSLALPAVAEVLETILCPTTVITGEHDDVGYLSIGDELARRLPQAHQVRIPGAGHFLNMDEPDRFNDELLALLASMS